VSQCEAFGFAPGRASLHVRDLPVAQALRGVRAYDASAPLVIFDSLDILGASVFVLDEDGLAQAADRLEALLPLP
jgi:hypothetical protein